MVAVAVAVVVAVVATAVVVAAVVRFLLYLSRPLCLPSARYPCKTRSELIKQATAPAPTRMAVVAVATVAAVLAGKLLRAPSRAYGIHTVKSTEQRELTATFACSHEGSAVVASGTGVRRSGRFPYRCVYYYPIDLPFAPCGSSAS